MKKIFTLFILLLLLPVTALAATGAPSMLYVGNQPVISGNDITYWTTDKSTGGLTKYEGNDDSWNVKYDPNTATLTLNGATIQGAFTSSPPYGAGIYALSSSNQPVALTIELIGTNTITGHYGIYVIANQISPPGTDATLVIKNSSDNGDNGSLTVTGTGESGLLIVSGTGNASLTIENATVNASTSANYAAGVCVQSGTSTTDSPNISLSVDGGSLTASGGGNNDGIKFYVGAPEATNATTSLTVSNNAIVDARNGGISASRISVTLPTPTPTDGNSSGIVFDGTEGTVYGDVELQEDLEIGEGESLTIPEGSSINCNGKLTNNGTILASGGAVTGNLSGGTAVTTPSITAQPTGQTVTEGNTAEFSVTASDAQTYQWQQSTDSGSNWTDISGATSASYTINSTTISMSGYQYRCVVKSASGVSVISQAATLTVTASTGPTTYTISTAEQLYAFANAVNGGNTTANAVLTADITLDSNSTVWTPIGKDNSYMYTGTFDGDGHTIFGLQCSVSSGDVAGLFGVIGSSGVVKNVGIADSKVAVSTDQNAYAGGLCGHNAGTITNCTSTGTVTSEGDYAIAGGVCGRNYGAITNCTSTGTVTAEGDAAAAGGVCGQNYANGSDVTAAISNCTSTGAVTAEGQYAYAGGVCGYFDGGNIKNCYSTGTVTSTATFGATYAGGVCGYFDGGDIKNCYSTGAVTSTATSGDAYAGGVCGRCPSIGDGSGGTITNCYWLTDSAQGGIGLGDGEATEKTTDQFASGEVAWLLNGQQTGGPWRQGSSGMPVLEGNLPEGVTSYVPVRITIVMPDDTEQYRYTTERSTVASYPTGYAFFLEDGNTQTWINQGTQTYDADATIYAENMTLEKIPAKAPTCTADGHSAYWYCAAFDKYFKDENGVTEITYESTVIPKTSHELTQVAAKEPTCTEDGNIEYWTCANCAKCFSDKAGTTEIEPEDVVIPATGHHYVNGTCIDCGHRDPDYRPDPISYYNIYVEDVCDGVEVSTSKQVVREGGSITVYVEKDTANYTFDNFKVYYKEGYYDSWDELKEGTQPGEYPIKNIWTHIYIKAEGAEEKEDPTGIESIEGVKVYTKDGSLYVQTPQREQVIIVSMSGAVVKNEEQIGLKQYHGLQPGIYIVRVGDRAYKVRLN